MLYHVSKTHKWIPPKCYAFEMHYSAVRVSACELTKCISGSSGFSNLRFGWAKPALSCRIHATSSITPDALKQCPVRALVELIKSSRACSWNTDLIAWHSV